MPELPEVEVTRRSVAASLAGAEVTDAAFGKPLRWPPGCPASALAGRRIGDMQRRGKYLWLPLGPRPGHAADDAGGLLIHLGMSGSLSFEAEPADRPGPHDHFELVTTRGTLRLRDPRRFGAVVWSGSLQADPARKLLAGLGAEPFDPDLTPAVFHAALKQRRSAVKQVLLAGDIVVGAGNIYACEALFHAGIDPRTRADRVSGPRAERLLAAVRMTLARAMAVGGSTLRDFRDAHGMGGEFQAEAAVYGREGQPCRQCATPLRRIVQGQRASYYCPACQRR